MPEPSSNALLALLAAVAKKPLQTLFEPTLERVRKWSEDKELMRKAGHPSLEKVFAKYLKQAIQDFAHVQSIAFSKEHIPLAKIYQPLSLDWMTAGRGKPTENFHIFKEGSPVIIIDSAGMGKTTYAKYLAIRVCAETDQVPIFFNLRNFDPEIKLITALRNAVTHLDEDFSQALFAKLVILGRFFIILDGFDEVDPASQANAKAQIEELANKCGNSKIVVTSRPQPNLPAIPSAYYLKIQPLTLAQATSLILKYDQYSKSKLGERLIKELKSAPKRFIETPLLLSLLYRTYGYRYV